MSAPSPETGGTFRGIDPAAISPLDAYRILLNCVSPRPIAFVSTLSELSDGGLPNLAPFSFFMAGGANPPSVVISPTTDRNGRHKDTFLNIEKTREYVINVVTWEMRDRMNITSAEYPYGISEWQEAGFTPAPCHKVRPARVLESPLSIECKLFQVVPHGDGPMSANYVIGEVVYFHVSEALMDGDVIDPQRVEYLSRMSGDWYARANADSMFEMARPPRPEKPGL